jgi:hypothetical protein
MASPVILSTQKAEISMISSSKSIRGELFLRSYLKNTEHKNRADRMAPANQA